MAIEPLFLDLIQVYRDAYQALLTRLADQELRGLSTAHTRALLSEIDDIIAQLKQYQNDWINHTIPLAYREGADAAADKLLKKYRMTDIDISFGGIHIQAVNAIVRDTFNDIAAATEYMAENLKQAIRDAAKEKYRIGLITGETRSSLTKELVGELSQKGFTIYLDEKGRYIPLREYANALLEEQWVGFVDKAGRRWDLLNYSEMLTRTKVLEATNIGTKNRLTQNGLDLVLISSHGATDWCRFYENRVFSISGKSTEYPPLSEVPNGGCPMHPRCKHSETPFVEKFESKELIEYGKGIDKQYLGLNTKDGHADQAKLRQLERDALKPKRNKNAVPENVPYKKFGTLDDAKQWAEKKYPHIAWDFNGVHIETLNPSLKEFDRLASEYPEVSKRLTYFGTHKSEISPIWGYHWEEGELAHASKNGILIGVNPKYYGDENGALIKAIEKTANNGFHPKVCNNIESIVTHEFGHQVYNWQYSKSSKSREKLLDFCRDNFSREQAKTVSVYACYSWEEAWAEAFAALYHGEIENELVKALKSFLDENVKRL